MDSEDLQDDKAKAGERRAQSGRGMSGARWDDSRDDRRGKTIEVMVRLPVWGKGERRERDGGGLLDLIAVPLLVIAWAWSIVIGQFAA